MAVTHMSILFVFVVMITLNMS